MVAWGGYGIEAVRTGQIAIVMTGGQYFYRLETYIQIATYSDPRSSAVTGLPLSVTVVCT